MSIAWEKINFVKLEGRASTVLGNILLQREEYPESPNFSWLEYGPSPSLLSVPLSSFL